MVNQLALYQYHHDADWQESIASAFSSLGLQSYRPGLQKSLVAWNQKYLVHATKSLLYANAYELSKVWIGQPAIYLRIAPKRIYFDSRTPDQPLQTSENDLFTERNKPSSPSPNVSIRGVLGLANKLGESCKHFSSVPAAFDEEINKAHDDTKRLFGQVTEQPCDKKIWEALSKFGPYSVPEQFGVRLVCAESERTFGDAFLPFLQDFMGAAKLGTDVKLVPLSNIEKRLDELTRSKDSPRKTTQALLIVVDTLRGEPISDRLSSLLARLNSLEVPYRLVSSKNKDPKWSARDRLVALLQAAGGRPFALKLPVPTEYSRLAFLGVDLGHPDIVHKSHSPESWLTVSLVDSQGAHIRTWKARLNRRDETATPSLLSKLLTDISANLETLLPYRPEALVILRDGRLHKAETLQIYRDALNIPFTFVEVSKGSNPIIYTTAPALTASPPGSACLFYDSKLAFLMPVAAKNAAAGLPQTLKIYLTKNGDQLGLGIANSVKLIAGLCYAPGLGLDPHILPAPIYWANGIASVNEDNLQFSGQRVSLLDQN